MLWLSKAVCWYGVRGLAAMLLASSVCWCADGAGSYMDVSDESEANVPVRLSFQFVDQFDRPAAGVSCEVEWYYYKKASDSRGRFQMVSAGGGKKLNVNADENGRVLLDYGSERGAGGYIIVNDNGYIRNVGYLDACQFALSEFYRDKFRTALRGAPRHAFDPDRPEKIRVWRRIGFKPMICYADQDNELDLASAKGEVCFDVTTFQPVETGGDFVLKWDVGTAVSPQGISWMWSPEGWDRQLHYTITAVDGQIWPLREDREWLSAHGVVPERMPPGLPVLDVNMTLPPGGHPGRQRFLLVSRNDRVCAKVSLAFSLRDALKGLVRVSLGGTMVNPAGPPSLEIQPSRERDKLEAHARQQITTINIPLRGIGSGPLPIPGPTADEAWATYEKACVERGVKPIPRPLSR